jgi:hypothetical protein
MIKITESNMNIIAAEIEAVENRCTARTITTAAILSDIEHIEKKLAAILYKKDWAGLEIECNPNAQSFPGAYKGTPESTQYRLIRRSTGWYVTRIRRTTCTTRPYYIDGLDAKANEMAEFVKTKF